MNKPRPPGVNEAIVSSGLPNKIRSTLGKIPFSKKAVSAFYCAKDPSTATHIKAALFGALTYFIMPIDAIPDFIPFLGYLDDWGILVAVYKLTKRHVTEDHIKSAEKFLLL